MSLTPAALTTDLACSGATGAASAAAARSSPTAAASCFSPPAAEQPPPSTIDDCCCCCCRGAAVATPRASRASISIGTIRAAAASSTRTVALGIFPRGPVSAAPSALALSEGPPRLVRHI